MRETIEFVIGTDVDCSGEACGQVAFIVVDPLARKLTHLIVAPDSAGEPSRLVPVTLVKRTRDGVELLCAPEEFQALEPAMETHFLRDVPGGWGPRSDQVLGWPFFAMAPGGAGTAAAEPPMVPALQNQVRVPPGEVLVHRGEQVHARDGWIGKVRGLVVDPADGAVTHVLLDEGHLWGRKQVAIPIGDVSDLRDEGVAVRLTKDEVRDLPPAEIEGLETAAPPDPRPFG